MTQQELINKLRNELLSDKELYNAFVASIESALLEIPSRIDIQCMARRITDRIIGREES